MEFIEQSLGLFQIEGVEALGEPAIDRSEKIAGRIPLALIAPEPRASQLDRRSYSDQASMRVVVWSRHRLRCVTQLSRFDPTLIATRATVESAAIATAESATIAAEEAAVISAAPETAVIAPA